MKTLGPVETPLRLLLAALLAIPVASCSDRVHVDRQSVERPAWTFVANRKNGIDVIQRSGDPSQSYIIDVKSTGIALLDYDRDGLLDICFSCGSTIQRQVNDEPGFGLHLFRNLSGLHFEEVTEQCGIGSFGWACGLAAADVDGNGWTDLFVTCYGQDRLLKNRDGHFEDVSDAAGLLNNGWSTSAAFGDLDRDGDLDIYVAGYLEFDFRDPPRQGSRINGIPLRCIWSGRVVPCGPGGLPARADTFYENRGDGTFQVATEKFGFSRVKAQYGLGVVMADLVGDSGLDVFVANDGTPNFLFENRAGYFREIGVVSGVSSNEQGKNQAAMGVDVCDMDSNGLLDLVVTNFENEAVNLYLNAGNRTFFDRAGTCGVASTSRSPLSWGVGCFDFNNDGVLDLYVANGHVYKAADEVQTSEGYRQRDHLYVGETRQHEPFLRERGKELGISDRRCSRSAAFGDLDNDGDVDIVVCHLNDYPAVYENRAPTRHNSLSIALRQAGMNAEAIGARVEVRVGKLFRVAEVHRQFSFQASSDPRLHVGLGEVEPVGTVRVRWPNGHLEDFQIPIGKKRLTLEKGQGIAVAR